MDALEASPAAGGSVGDWLPSDSGASPDIVWPLRSGFLPTGCAGGIWPATCGQSPAFLFRRYLPGAACREWPLTGRHFTSTEPYPDGQPDGGATDPELMIGRSDHRLLFVEHQDVIELDTFRCGPFGFQGQRLAALGHRTAAGLDHLARLLQ